jgi:hypothetical protein
MSVNNNLAITREWLEWLETQQDEDLCTDVETWLNLGCRTRSDVLAWIEPGP